MTEKIVKKRESILQIDSRIRKNILFEAKSLEDVIEILSIGRNFKEYFRIEPIKEEILFDFEEKQSFSSRFLKELSNQFSRKQSEELDINLKELNETCEYENKSFLI